MMRRILLALAILAVPGTAMAQGGGRTGMAQQAFAQQNAFQLLLEKKTEYNLTAVQVARVDTIAKALEKKHEPIVKELQALMQGSGIRNMTPAQREGLMAKRQAMQADVDKEMEKLPGILTEEQHKKLTEELAQRMQRRRPPPNR